MSRSGNGYCLKVRHLKFALSTLFACGDNPASVEALFDCPPKQRQRIIQKLLLGPEATELLELLELSKPILVNFKLQSNGAHAGIL